MNIGIFETEHFEGAYPVIKLFDTPGNKLILFTNDKTYKRFHDLFRDHMHQYEWVIVNPGSNRLAFFKKIYREAKKHKLDIFYFNTISNNHLLFGLLIKFLPVMRVIITIHDINCFFESRLTTGLRDGIRHIGKKAILKEVHEFNVVSDTMIPYLQKKRNLIKIHNIPGAVFEHRIKKICIEGFVHLVVPGSIDHKRRDYEKVFDLLSAAESRHVDLRITLLGGPHEIYGASIIARAKAWRGQYTSLFYYEEKIVDQDEFDKKLDSAHFVFIPSVVQTKICGDIPEIYGITKSSGNIFDVIKHAKPFLIPQALVVSPDLENSCITYQSIAEIISFLEAILQFPDKYADWSERAVNNSMKYTIEKIRAKNPLLFARL